jgi:hypothetical protein
MKIRVLESKGGEVTSFEMTDFLPERDDIVAVTGQGAERRYRVTERCFLISTYPTPASVDLYVEADDASRDSPEVH